MQPNYYLCDVCGDKVEKDGRLFIATGREMCASGNGYETVGQSVDLCQKHMRQALLICLRSKTNPRYSDYEKGNQLLSRIEEWRKNVKLPPTTS